MLPVATPPERGYYSVSHDDLERQVRQRIGDVASRDHCALFYELDDALLDAVARYLWAALRGGDAAIAIATAAHAPGIEQRCAPPAWTPPDCTAMAATCHWTPTPR
jgi:hypothetical protein